MRDVATAILRWRDQPVACAIATVVAASGSRPYAAGACMAVNEYGEIAGSISGGCVDSAVIDALEATADDGKLRRLGFEAADFGDVAGVGLVCGGAIEVVCKRVSGLQTQFFAALIAGESAVLFERIDAGAVDATSDERLVTDTGTSGTVGDDAFDSCVDVVSARTQAQTQSGVSHVRRLDSGTEVYVRSTRLRPVMVIAGLTGFTPALVDMARMLGYDSRVCDARERFASAGGGQFVVNAVWPDVLLRELEAEGHFDADSVILVCTHDTKFDVPALIVALRSSAGFVGAIGSRRTCADRSRRLREAGLSEAELARLCQPVGLDIGAESAEETAVSIFAEILAARSGRDGAALKDGDGPIHVRRV